MTQKRGLTDLQELFAIHYIGDQRFNATRAAEAAGYAGDYSTLRAVGSENLAKPNIRDRISELLETEVMASLEVAARLRSMARGEIPTRRYTSGGQVKEVYDMLGSLEVLGRHLGMFADRHEVTGAGGGPIAVEVIAERQAKAEEQLRGFIKRNRGDGFERSLGSTNGDEGQ